MGFCNMHLTLNLSPNPSPNSSSTQTQSILGLSGATASLGSSSRAEQQQQQQLWQMTSQQRTAYLAQEALNHSAAATGNEAVASAAQIFLFYSQPERIDDMCWPSVWRDVGVLLGLGLLCRLLLAAIIKVKVLLRQQS
jgi:hypothetical protein